MILLLALYPFGGFTLLPFQTGTTRRIELVAIALFWPLCWVVILVMIVAAVTEWLWWKARRRWLLSSWSERDNRQRLLPKVRQRRDGRGREVRRIELSEIL